MTRAAELDSASPMPLWGITLAYGPNINDFEMDRERAESADEYVTKAQALGANGSEEERAYIQALSKRYSSDPNVDLKKLQVEYKDAMAALARRYPRDLDAQTLYAESLMDLRPGTPPVRETLGAALVASGDAARAEQVFRQDLTRNPGNGQSLFGLWKSLEAQHSTADAAGLAVSSSAPGPAPTRSSVSTVSKAGPNRRYKRASLLGHRVG